MRADGDGELGRDFFLIKEEAWSLSRQPVAPEGRRSGEGDRGARLQGRRVAAGGRDVAVSASDPTRGVLLPPRRRASRPDARRRWRPALPMAIAP